MQAHRKGEYPADWRETVTAHMVRLLALGQGRASDE